MQTLLKGKMENKAKSIKEILANDSYVIPRYQRNYAWGKAEISQLIKDIDEFFPKEDNDKPYYVGSLVCFKREDGSFELIDGQQRHTTLTLINLVLKNWKFQGHNKLQEHKNILESVPKPNIKFDSRKRVQSYIENLYKEGKEVFQNKIDELNIQGTGNFKDAIEIIQGELRNVDIKKFTQNFYNNVFLFRVEVPEKTDLNHYFEIMNNRGEQLEKHEIVKALLMGEDMSKEEQEKFAKIWDACADMGNYVFFNFDKEVREKLFSKEGNLMADSFESVCVNKNEKVPDSATDNFENKESSQNTLASIIENHKIPYDFPKEEKFIKDKYKSIIDFPNFLLQILKIKEKEVSLDDKKLLEQFERFKPKPKEFIFDLLKCRVLFDKYVIKQDLADADENKQNWSIRKLNTDFETTLKTFNSEDENGEELIKLQVMLYYSDSTNTYNNWLQEILNLENYSVENYTDKVWGIAKDKFQKKDKSQKDKLSYPNISIFNLYFIDYLLWKLYKEDVRGKKTINDIDLSKLAEIKKKIFHKKELFKDYRSRQINSREHLLSQEHAKRYSIDEKTYNSIGNLCLISTSQNSSGNKENPIDKKKMFQNDNSSLKRLVMFESYEDDKWGADQIEKHKEEIESIIGNYLNAE